MEIKTPEELAKWAEDQHLEHLKNLAENEVLLDEALLTKQEMAELHDFTSANPEEL